MHAVPEVLQEAWPEIIAGLVVAFIVALFSNAKLRSLLGRFLRRGKEALMNNKTLRQIAEESFLDLDGLERFLWDNFELTCDNIKGKTLKDKIFYLFRKAEVEGWSAELEKAMRKWFPKKFA